jgi:hypothetical protein
MHSGPYSYRKQLTFQDDTEFRGGYRLLRRVWAILALGDDVRRTSRPRVCLLLLHIDMVSVALCIVVLSRALIFSPPESYYHASGQASEVASSKVETSDILASHNVPVDPISHRRNIKQSETLE